MGSMLPYIPAPWILWEIGESEPFNMLGPTNEFDMFFIFQLLTP